MNKEEARSRLLDLYPTGSFQYEKGVVFIDFLLDLLYINDMQVMPVSSDISSTDLDEFEQTILAWNANEKVEYDDVNGSAVLHALKEKGWVIQPPR